MAADVQCTFTPDSDPNVVSSNTVFTVNGAVAGSVTLPGAGAMANYLAISPAPPALKVGDVVSTVTITTDNLGQASPGIPSPNNVTIVAIPAPPTGVTGVGLKQVGSP
jgi:hypothetical protein